MKTIEQWEKEFDTQVLDGDGFPEGTKRNETLFTEKEFVKNCWTSTIMFSDKINVAMKSMV